MHGGPGKQVVLADLDGEAVPAELGIDLSAVIHDVEAVIACWNFGERAYQGVLSG